MPTYEVTDPKSGRVLQLTGTTPPTDQDLDGLFAQHKGAPSPDNFMTKAKGVGEAVLSTGLGAVNWIPSGVIKAAGVISGQTKEGTELGDFVQDKLSYQPKTEIGKKLSGYVAAPFEYISEKSKEAADWTYDKTGSPLLATAVRTAGEAIPFVAPVGLAKGIKGIKGAVKEQFRSLEGVIPETPGVPTSLLPEIGRDQRVSPEYNKPVPEPPKIEAGKPVPAPPVEPLPEVKAKTPPAEIVQPAATSGGKEPASNPLDYPSAEEFVKAQGEPVYHETQSKGEVEFKPQSYGSAGEHSYFYFSDKPGTLSKMIKGGASKDVSPVKQTTTAFVDAKNPLDLTGDLSLSIPDWTKLFESKNIKLPDTILERMGKAEHPNQKRSAWQMFRSDNGEMRKALMEAGYDSIKWDEWGGTTTVALSPDQIKTKSQLTDIFNQAQEGKGTVEPPKVEPIKQEIPKAEQPLPEQPKPVEPPANFEFKSRVYDRLQQEHPEELKGDVTYTKINREQDAGRATDLINNDKQKAYRLAMNIEESPDVTNTAVNIAMSEKAFTDGNLTLYSNLVKNRSLAQTRRGQEIVSEKGSVTDNDTSRYVKELVAARLEKVGKNYFDDLKGNLAKKSNKTKAMDSIDKEVTKAQGRMSNKMLDIKEAQSIIDRLMCK